jgi:hypothetical protein
VDHSDTGKAAVEQQEFDADTQGDHAFQERADHVSHGLLRPYATERQGIAAPPDYSVGGGRGEKMRRATLGFAAADFVVMCLLHGAMVRQRDQIDSDAAAALAQALRDQLGQEGIDLPFECIEVAELLGQCPQHRRGRRGTFQLLTGLMDREPGGGGKDQDPQQIPTVNSAGHGQGQRVERVDGEGVHVVALQGILRIRRHRDSPMRLRKMASPSHYRRVPCFFKPYMTITPFSTTETPKALADTLHAVCGVFDLDPCAVSRNEKATIWARVRFTPADDGLSLPWCRFLGMPTENCQKYST